MDEQHEDEIRQDREMIRRSRALIAEIEELIATSMDQISESLRLMGLFDRKWPFEEPLVFHKRLLAS